MRTQTESIVLTNKQGQKFRIYYVEGSNEAKPIFCIGMEGEDHFQFEAGDAEDIINAINSVVGDYLA